MIQPFGTDFFGFNPHYLVVLLLVINGAILLRNTFLLSEIKDCLEDQEANGG